MSSALDMPKYDFQKTFNSHQSVTNKTELWLQLKQGFDSRQTFHTHYQYFDWGGTRAAPILFALTGISALFWPHFLRSVVVLFAMTLTFQLSSYPLCCVKRINEVLMCFEEGCVRFLAELITIMHWWQPISKVIGFAMHQRWHRKVNKGFSLQDALH